MLLLKYSGILTFSYSMFAFPALVLFWPVVSNIALNTVAGTVVDSNHIPSFNTLSLTASYSKMFINMTEQSDIWTAIIQKHW